MDNIYKAVQLTIDSQNLALSKRPTHVYIANQYVDTNDTPLITAPFIIQKALENGTGVVDIVSSTIGSIYEVRLLCEGEMLISGYFYMPPMNAKFSELELYTSYPPRTPPVVNEFWQQTEQYILEKTNTLLNFVQVFNSLSSMRLSLGYLEELLTTKKSNLVSAINEVVSVKADKATTLVGYGISDAYTKSEIDTDFSGIKTLYDKNVQAGAGANGWTAELTVDKSGATQQQVNYNGGSKWHSRVGGYLKNERAVLANGDIVRSTVDGNTNDPNVDMTGWINPEAQQARVVMIDQFSSVAAALEWVKSNVNNYLYVKAGTSYTLPTGNVYFNRVICLDGKADFIVPAATNLSYINFTDGSEVLCLKNIRFLIAGHRGTLTASTTGAYTSAGTVKTANLENLEIYGLTDLNNIDSWRDDVGMTRVQGFIGYRVSDSSRIANVNFYGVASLASVGTVSSGAVHSEENINGYNAETGIYLPVGMWRSGTSKNINIFNNELQKDYWINRDRAVSPIGRNGKNCIMCEADHSTSYVIDGATMVYGIERSVYCTSTNSVVRNTSDDKCFSMTTIKSPKDAGSPKSAIDGFNLICRNPTNAVGVQDTYGWLKGVLERVRIENDAKNVTKPFLFSDLGHLTCKNLFAKNTGIPLYFGDGNNISKLEVIDSEFVDCYDANLASLYYKAVGTKTIGELAIDNVRHYCADIGSVPVANIPTVGIALNGVVKFKFNNSRSFAKVNPFSKASETTYIEVLNSKFILKNSDPIANTWNYLKSSTTFQANIFDFTVDLLTTNATVPNLKVDARFKKINDSGMVNCADYWSEINIGYPVTVANGISLMTVGDKSFELTASFNEKLLKFYWDASTKTITQIVNFGGLFATTITSDKINIYVNTADNRLIVNIGNGTWTGGDGNLSVKINRF